MENIIMITLQHLQPEVIIFGGLTLTSLALVILVWRISVRYGNHYTGVLSKNTEAWIENAKAQQKHTDTIDTLNTTIKELSTIIKEK